MKMPLALQISEMFLRRYSHEVTIILAHLFSLDKGKFMAFIIFQPSGTLLFRDYAMGCFAQIPWFFSVYCKQIVNRSREVDMDRRWIRAAFCNVGHSDFHQLLPSTSGY